MKKKFNRSFEELKNIVDFTADFFRRESIEPALRHIVDLCLEELFVNMVTYNKETREQILIELEPCTNGVKASLTDFNVERFDPRNMKPVDITAPLEERTPGGLGLFLVMKMVNSIHYEYRQRNSKVTFIAEGARPDV